MVVAFRAIAQHENIFSRFFSNFSELVWQIVQINEIHLIKWGTFCISIYLDDLQVIKYELLIPLRLFI